MGFKGRCSSSSGFPRLSPLRHNSYLITLTQLLLSQEDLFDTESLYNIQWGCLFTNWTPIKVEVILWLMVSRPVCLLSVPTWGLWPDFNYCQAFVVFCLLGALADKRMRFTLRITTGHCQHCHSHVQVLQNLWPYVTVSFETGFPFCQLYSYPINLPTLTSWHRLPEKNVHHCYVTWTMQKTLVLCSSIVFFCNPISFAVYTSTVSSLCKNVSNGM
jgi:hypothetical protein